MKKTFTTLVLLCTLGFTQVNAQECFFLKNVLDTLYQINPSTGLLVQSSLPTDFSNQSFHGYLNSIDPSGRRYMFVTLLSDTSFDDFGLKVIDLDSMQMSSVPLSGYEAASPGLGQFSFHGLEYGAIADQLYLAPISGDSLYAIDMNSGQVSAQQAIPNFSNTYSYLQTFYQSEQRYAMIGLDDNGQRRFYQIDLDDDTTYISSPMSFAEPLRGLEVSDMTGKYYAVSDADQQFYEIDPLTGSMTALFAIPAYQNAFGYLHSYDYNAEQYLLVGLDSSSNLQLFSIFPTSGTINSVPFPVPLAAYFGLEATNTLYIARMLNQLNPTSIEPNAKPLFRLFPNPTRGQLKLSMQEALPVEMAVYDLSGKLLYQNAFAPQGQIELRLAGFAAGTYLLKAWSLVDGRIWQERFVILP
ncbi:MAG: T9SS type A sorting domain-containing protein [Bacteroidia bacterium]